MNFHHHPTIWQRFPQLCAGAIWARDIRQSALAQSPASIDALLSQARERLNAAGGSEGQLPSIQAWRRGFSELGLKPTQYRCAAESLLRRLRQDGDLPRIHPLVDTLNALSVGHALPIAVFDLRRVHGDLEVRLAIGSEHFTSFSGEPETPDPGEVVFVDSAGHAHARRWCHRQSAQSAVQADTTEVLIVAEALHVNAQADVQALLAHICHHLALGFNAQTVQAVLSSQAPRLELVSPSA